jgi:hypothetical protein
VPDTFTMLPNSVVARADLSALAHRVYDLLLWHCGPTYECRPSVKRLADLSGVSTRQLERALSELRKAGLVTYARRAGDGQPGVYRLSLVPRADRAAHVRAATRGGSVGSDPPLSGSDPPIARSDPPRGEGRPAKPPIQNRHRRRPELDGVNQRDEPKVNQTNGVPNSEHAQAPSPEKVGPAEKFALIREYQRRRGG